MHESHKLRARRITQELLTQGDLAVIGEIFAPGCIHHGPLAHGLGKEGTTQWISTLRHGFPDLCAIVEDEIAEGDLIVQRLSIAGTHQGTFLGVPPTGRRVGWCLVEVLRAGHGGTFTHHWSIWDQLDVLMQLDTTRGTIPEEH